MLAFSDSQLGLIRRKPKTQQRLFEDVQIGRHRCPRHTGIPRDGAHVDRLAMEKGRHGQEPRKTRQASDQRLGLNLFFQIKLGIGGQRVGFGVGVPHNRQKAELQCLVEVEFPAEFLGDEGVHRAAQGTAGQQVHTGTLQLAGARTAQDETQPLFLDKTVHLVQEPRQPLDLVDDHPGPRLNRPHLICEKPRTCQQLLVFFFIKQVDHMGIGKSRAQPGALSGAARPHEKKTLPGGVEDTSNHS